jgi:plastocyanin
MIPACRLQRSSPRLTRLAVLLALLALVPVPAHADTYVVNLSNFAVEPKELTIRAGDTVEWRIMSGRHSSTAKDEAWDSGELEQGATFTQQFDLPGVYPYFCTPHDFMRGTVTVLEAPTLWERMKAWITAAGW